MKRCNGEEELRVEWRGTGEMERSGTRGNGEVHCMGKMEGPIEVWGSRSSNGKGCGPQARPDGSQETPNGPHEAPNGPSALHKLFCLHSFASFAPESLTNTKTSA